MVEHWSLERSVPDRSVPCIGITGLGDCAPAHATPSSLPAGGLRCHLINVRTVSLVLHTQIPAPAPLRPSLSPLPDIVPLLLTSPSCQDDIFKTLWRLPYPPCGRIVNNTQTPIRLVLYFSLLLTSLPTTAPCLCLVVQRPTLRCWLCGSTTMAPSRDDAAPHRSRNAGDDLAAGPSRRHSHDAVLRPMTRRSLSDTAASRVGQHEPQPIPSRLVSGATDKQAPTTIANNPATNMDKVESSSAMANLKPSRRENIRDKIRSVRADRRRRKFGGGTWTDRARDRLAAMYQKLIVEGLLKQKPLPPSADGRHIPLNPSDVGPDGLIDLRSQKPYVTNYIRSSRYTAWDFVPRQLLFQFSKLGNFYFLVVGILQLIPGLSTVGRWTTIVPLGIFIALSMAKEGYDDFRRYKLDKAENQTGVLVIRYGIREGRPNPSEKAYMEQEKNKKQQERKKQVSKWWAKAEKSIGLPEDVALQDLENGATAVRSDEDGDWMVIQWQDVQVGDVVRLRRDEAVPADMVVLHATGPNSVAYIDTMALDGETNLKSRQACPLLIESCSTMDGLRTTKATVVSEDPNIDLYNYDGKTTVDNETLPLSLNNVVYRGSTVRNTTKAIGLIINTGEECKIRKNANKNVSAKKPATQSIINIMILMQICVVLCLSMGMTIGYWRWKHSEEKRSFYLVSPGMWDATVPFKEIFIGYIIMFNTLIPLSLYISLEIIKIGQLLLLHDVDMYDPVTNTPMIARTTTILENLGQVGHIFSDKTGTLTENLMRFRKMTVAGVACLHDMDVLRDEMTRQKSIDSVAVEKGKEKSTLPMKQTDQDDKILGEASSPTGRPAAGRTTSAGSVPRRRSSTRPDEEPEMKTEDLLEYIREKPHTVFSRKVKHFLLCIALCHTCLPEVKDDGQIEYQAASPDELALVEAARDLGYLLIDRPAQSITLQTPTDNGSQQTETYQVLDVIEFSSQRKRMSIIVKLPDGRICVFCKGADNVIMARLKLAHLAEQKAKEVNRRSSMRKTFEQDRAMRRMSAHAASTQSTPRSSIAIRRNESTDRIEGVRMSLSRRSTELSNLSQSEAVATWLRSRQTDGLATPRASTDLLRSPRQSIGRIQSFESVEHNVDESMAGNEAAIIESCLQHVNEFASEGLRTLVYAYRYIDQSAYAEWKRQYREAETSLDDRQERIEQAAELIEQRFNLAGATAIEDKLQEGVPDTIDKLRRANIKVWMLTGDKRETAINIGHSARVCRPFSELVILDAEEGNILETMKTMLNDVSRGMVPHAVVVIDGQTLAQIEAEDDLAVLFYDLAIRVDSVICCRSSPAQKASLVKSMRRYVPKSMTLAIGDGANDIGMIQTSHVGIGISGREGLQAARISDYSIAQFRFLQKLLFVHGRWNYLRTGKYVLGTFWKEMLFFLVQAQYQRFTGYTGTSLFESWSLTIFNSVFTSLPVILLGIFEKDLQAETLLAVPELYAFGQEGRGFSFFQYFGWMFMATMGSFVSFYFMWAVYRNVFFTADTSLYAIGDVAFTVGVIFINIKLL